MKDHSILVRDLLLLLAFAGWAMALPHYGSEFAVSMALTCLMYVALSSSWGLFCGSTRYLSLATSIGAWLGAIYLHYNLGFLVAFNLGKIALFGMVYYQVLAQSWARRLVAVATVVAVVARVPIRGGLGSMKLRSRMASTGFVAAADSECSR